MQTFLAILTILIIIGLVATYWYFLIPFVVIFVIWKIYETVYFNGDDFHQIKERIQTYINDCNELNQHIESLKSTRLVSHRLDSGRADYGNESKWKARKSELSKQEYAPNIYNFSRTVCDGARRDPFKYVCKYFGISTDEPTLEEFEEILNNFEAAEEGKVSLQREKENIISSIQEDIPGLIRKFSKKKLEQKLGFEPVDLGTAYFPRYTFKYVIFS